MIALGVALSIRSDLGTSPISSIPYVSNLLVPSVSAGTFTILMNALLVLIQIIILRNITGLAQLSQLPLLRLFALFIDLNLFLTRSFVSDHSIWQLLTVVLSCFLMAFGIFLELKADVGYLPGEGLLLVVSETYNWNFGKVKVVIDSIVVVIALFSVLIFHGRLEGVREGTR